MIDVTNVLRLRKRGVDVGMQSFCNYLCLVCGTPQGFLIRKEPSQKNRRIV